MFNKWVIFTFFAIAGLFAFQAASFALPVSLGTAGPGNFAVLETGTGGLSVHVSGGGSAPGITGNVGINSNGTLTLDNQTFVHGNVTLGTGAQVSTSGNGAVTGTTTTNQAAMTQAATDANNAATAAAALAVSGGGVGVSSITTTTTLTPGVYDISNFNLNQKTVTLEAGGSYVFDITGGITINGPGGVSLASGLSPADVLYNVESGTVHFSGGGNTAVLNGIVLALNSDVQLSPGVVNGEIISSHNIQLTSGADVVGVVPEASTNVLLILGGIMACAISRRRPNLAAPQR
jgi:Ice-binding-like